jgi:hypothetical protein
MTRLAPAIAEAMQAKAAADADFADDLSELLDDRADGGVLDEPAAFADGQSQIDGAALLTAVYGSSDAALKALSPLAPAASGRLPQLAELSAVAVVGAMAKAHDAGSSLSIATASGGGFVQEIIAALIKGALQGITRQILPRRRRYTDYFGRKRTSRRRSSSPSLNDIFGAILGRILRR